MTPNTQIDHEADLRAQAAAQIRDNELNAMADKMFQRMLHQFELIGWDMTSAHTRAEIAEDNRWVRSWRKGSARAAFTAAGVGVTMVITGVIWLLVNGFKAAIGAAKAMN